MGHFAPTPQTLDSSAPIDSSAWESITLSRFLRQLPPAVTLTHDAGERPLRWVEASDMDDPSDYLMDDELILTSGFPLLEHTEDQVWVDQLIGRLAQAKVSALGFGLEPYFISIPDTVLDVCRRHNLSLLKISASLPFAATGIAFAKPMGGRWGRAVTRQRGSHPRPHALPDPRRSRTAASFRPRPAPQSQHPTPGHRRPRSSPGRHPTVSALSQELTSYLFEQAADGASSQQFAMQHKDLRVDLAYPIRATLPAGRRAPLLGMLSVSFIHTPLCP